MTDHSDEVERLEADLHEANCEIDGLTGENSVLTGDLDAAMERIEALSDLIRATVDERDAAEEKLERILALYDQMGAYL